ncbi:MAG: hypothetical protein ACYDEI_04055 [Erysipelotrichaceae bacterium]|jgi:hypothetical protein
MSRNNRKILTNGILLALFVFISVKVLIWLNIINTISEILR